MSFEVRPVQTPEEYAAAQEGILQYFARELPTESQIAHQAKLLPFERMLAAFDQGRVIGGAGAFRFGLTVPGGSLPCAGVTIVGVLPTHRRRGALTAMMRSQLEMSRAEGEPLAALWASEETIYGRFGYGLASWELTAELKQAHAALATPFTPRGRFRLVKAAEALEPASRIYEEVQARRAGMIVRSRDWWEERRFSDSPERREPGTGAQRIVLLELDGEVRGYAIYRHHPKWQGLVHASRVEVLEALGSDAEAEREVWRYLLEIDLTETFHATHLPVDHALLQLLAKPRHASLLVGDGLWVRLVDVGAALSGRRYGAGGPVVFEVRDPFCPWNAGRWRLAGGEASRTDEAPDLVLGVDALASVYLGGNSFRALAEGLRVEERTPEALAKADALFRTERQPWCAERF